MRRATATSPATPPRSTCPCGAPRRRIRVVPDSTASMAPAGSLETNWRDQSSTLSIFRCRWVSLSRYFRLWLSTGSGHFCTTRGREFHILRGRMRPFWVVGDVDWIYGIPNRCPGNRPTRPVPALARRNPGRFDSARPIGLSPVTPSPRDTRAPSRALLRCIAAHRPASPGNSRAPESAPGRLAANPGGCAAPIAISLAGFHR